MMDIEKVASGEYPGAPTWPELEKWAMDFRVSIQMDPAPLPGVYECYAHSLRCGGQHGTLRGALYLLYHAAHGGLGQ